MKESVEINDLSEKLDLCLRSDRNSVNTQQDMILQLGFSKDYMSRIRSGTRRLSEDIFIKICKAFKVSQQDWFLPLIEFGKKLGFSRREVGWITHTSLPGIDFNSRINDRNRVGQIFDLIEGVWESYYYSVSRFDRVIIKKDLLVINGMNEDGFIECVILEEDIEYRGVCFPINNQLMFILEKDKIFNEIVVYCTNLPDRSPPVLLGILLCLSGGVDDMYTYPASAKAAFRYVRKLDETRRDAELDALRKQFCGYLDPKDVKEEDLRKIIKSIQNIVTQEAIPQALVTKRGH